MGLEQGCQAGNHSDFLSEPPPRHSQCHDESLPSHAKPHAILQLSNHRRWVGNPAARAHHFISQQQISQVNYVLCEDIVCFGNRLQISKGQGRNFYCWAGCSGKDVPLGKEGAKLPPLFWGESNIGAGRAILNGTLAAFIGSLFLLSPDIPGRSCVMMQSSSRTWWENVDSFC